MHRAILLRSLLEAPLKSSGVPAGCRRGRPGRVLTDYSCSLQPGKSSSTGNLLDKDDIAIPPPDYGMSSQGFPPQNANAFKQRPYSVAVPAFSQVSSWDPGGRWCPLAADSERRSIPASLLAARELLPLAWRAGWSRLILVAV